MLTILLLLNTLLLIITIVAYENKIKKLQKELAKILANRDTKYVKKVEIPLRELHFKLDFRGYLQEPIEERIREFTIRASENVWHCYKDYLRESIYRKVYDALVTDDRTCEENSRDFDIEVAVNYILPDSNNVEIKIKE